MADHKKVENALETLPDINSSEGRLEIMKRAAKGDNSVFPLVQQLLDRDQKEGGRLLHTYGDSFSHAAVELTRTAAGDDILIRESLMMKIRTVRDDLAVPNPTHLERILCERIALCWFDVYEMDRRYSDLKGLDLKNAQFRESRRDRAHKRFLSACKSLATVRRLTGPSVQVSVAQQVTLEARHGRRSRAEGDSRTEANKER